MRTTVKINGKKVGRYSTLSFARKVASEIYEAYAEMVIDGFTQWEEAMMLILQAGVKPDGNFVVTLNGENFENYLAPEDWISNRAAV